MEDIHATQFGKMYREPSAPTQAPTSVMFWRNSRKLKPPTPLFLDLREINGQLPDAFWEQGGLLLGEYAMHSFGESPKDAVESHLSRILQDDPPRKYYLSKTACLGILRRAEARGKELPPQLRDALILQAGLAPSDSTDTTET